MKKPFGDLLGARIKARREYSEFTQRELADQSYDDPEKIESYIRYIKSLEGGNPPAAPQGKKYKPLCETLNITEQEITKLKQNSSNADAFQEEEFCKFESDFGPVPEKLKSPSGLTRKQILYLAGLFNIPSPENLSIEELSSTLIQKGQDYQSQITDISDLMGESNELKEIEKTALDKMKLFQFKKTGEILEKARRISAKRIHSQLEDHTRIIELEARNMLLQDDVSAAEALLIKAILQHLASSEGSVVDTANRSARILFRHGYHGNTSGLEAAQRILEKAMAAIGPEIDPRNLAFLKMEIAHVIQTISWHRPAKDGEKLLNDAIELHRENLNDVDRFGCDVQKCTIRNYLGGALLYLGRNKGTQNADAILSEALSRLDEAANLTNRQEDPLNWGAVANNAALTNYELAIRTPNSASKARELFDIAVRLENASNAFENGGAITRSVLTRCNRVSVITDALTLSEEPQKAFFLRRLLVEIEGLKGKLDPRKDTFAVASIQRCLFEVKSELGAILQDPRFVEESKCHITEAISGFKNCNATEHVRKLESRQQPYQIE